MENAKELDQFYTNPIVAQQCMDLLAKKVNLADFDYFIEPSAGSGSFFSLLPKKKRIGLDLEPKHPEVIEQDFFTYTFPHKNKKAIAIGNPPFGKRSRLAISFFNHATEFCDVIAFIVPLQWRKWSVQSKIKKGWMLVHDETLPEQSFIFKDKPYGVRCSFQVWKKGDGSSLRLENKLPTAHADFEMFLYNNTREAEKYFDYEWDFAVPRQGYANYSRREINKDNCERTTQWIFFKAKNAKIKKRLMNIDYQKLAMKNTSTPGWGKADIVEYYIGEFDS